MKIAFLVTRVDKPSARYRVLQYIPLLGKEGYITEVYTIPKNPLERLKLFAKMKDFDIVFLQKKLFNAVEFYVLRKNSKKLIYDFDDAVMFKDSKNTKQFSKGRMKGFVMTIKNADMVIAGNQYLKSFAIKENAETHIIPTPIDMNRYTEKPLTASSDSLMLGWIGSSATLFYLERMKNVWDAIYDMFPRIKLKIVADKFFDCEKMPVIKKQWKYEDEINDLHSFDIGIMPLTDDTWSRGKCGFKLLQYMAVGVPSICSPVGVNKYIITDNTNGFWASNDQEWISKVSILIEDCQLRRRLGETARKTVTDHYSTKLTNKKMIEILRSL